MSLAKNVEFLRRLPKLNGLAGLGRGARYNVRSPLVETAAFGTNPGALRMFSFVPGSVPHRPALVVVLHGCGQTAAGYDLGAGWSTLAKRYGFALLMPEQQPTNPQKAPAPITVPVSWLCGLSDKIVALAPDHTQ